MSPEGNERDVPPPPTVDLRQGQGVQYGGHNVQHNYFPPPAPTSRSTRQRLRLVSAAVVVAVVVLSAGMCEDIRRAFGGGSADPSVSVASGATNAPCTQDEGWVVPDRSAQAPDPRWAVERPVTYQKWLHQHGAVLANESETFLTLRGSSATALVIDDVLVTLVARRPPLAGQLLKPRCDGGGPVDIKYVLIDLDRLSVGETVSLRSMYQSWVPPPPRRATAIPSADRVQLPFTVSNTDIAVLAVIATTDTCDCAWRVAVSWINGEKRGRVERPDKGPPFRLSAAPRPGP